MVNVFDQTISILIDPWATLSYVSSKIVEQCKLQVVKFKNPGLVQLATRAKKGVLAKVNICPIELAN